jgi:hypothetical protein
MTICPPMSDSCLRLSCLSLGGGQDELFPNFVAGDGGRGQRGVALGLLLVPALRAG